MKALVFEGSNQISIEDRPKPTIKVPSDAIVKLLKTTICGTDLHIKKGDVPTCSPDRILGHEGIGVIEEVGGAVTNLKKGDLVLISCITADGKCEYCRRGMYSHCLDGGWVLGHKIDGTQAEYVRIPHADMSLHLLNSEVNKDNAVLFSDVFPTSYECGVLNGKISPDNTVAIVGAGPIGLGVLQTAQLYSPQLLILIDSDKNRLAIASKLGATHIINNKEEDVVAKVLSLTNNKGVDTAIEAVGVPETFELCEKLVTPGGVIANIGVHGKKVDLHLEDLWSQNITITTRLVDTITTPLLLKCLQHNKLKPDLIISHHFNFNNILQAYEFFSDAATNNCLKVIIDF